MALELKVVIAAKDQTKKFRFNQEMSISEVCVEIKEKTGVGGYIIPRTHYLASHSSFLLSADHGLFSKGDEVAGRKTGWLLPDKTLLFYNFKSGVCTSLSGTFSGIAYPRCRTQLYSERSIARKSSN